MPVQYIGNGSAWKRQKGKTSGPTESGLFYYNVPYRGGINGMEAFRQSWQRGDSCPIAGYDGLKLVRSPEIMEEGQGFASAVLRFEGPDPNKDPGEDGDVQKIHKENQEKEITLAALTIENKGIYSYLAPVVTRTYTELGERSQPRSAPSMDDPEPKTLVDWEEGHNPLSVETLVQGHHPQSANPAWSVTTVSGFTSKDNDGTGWVHVEWHTKLLNAIAP